MGFLAISCINLIRFLAKVNLNQAISASTCSNQQPKKAGCRIVQYRPGSSSRFSIDAYSTFVRYHTLYCNLYSIFGATIYCITETGIEPVDYEQTEHYEITKTFLENPDRMLKELFRND